MCGCNYVDMFLCAGAISNAPTINTPPVTSSAISHFRTYLKTVYKRSPISPDSKWPPTPSRKYISLTVVEGGHMCRDEYIGHTLQGNIAASKRKEISIEQILEAGGQDKLNLVLVEGAPGIGKSTLVWELCRKWEECSCMHQYSLVILLRLREEEVQKIANINQLFFSCDSETIARKVLANHGRGILFILDGFDELPKPLQQKGFLLDLIKGKVLPKSTVLVTSRPSATAELLTSCRKHIEVLGFTQDSIETYATSIFSEQEELEKFKAYISASTSPSINSLMYVPLNAAIIVEIYRNCKSENLLPHTLTELYTQLCLTILNRYLKALNPPETAGSLEDLPPHLYQQFLDLSKVAFEGFKSGEVIFHNVPSCLVHFGFLDSVSAVYGGGGISYNFLHLTVQEFFAAYYISHLGSNGLEVFQQYGNVKRWNVVWRFVAGLTKFRYYEGYIYENMICERDDESLAFSEFFPQCLFEAQSEKYFSSALISLKTAEVYVCPAVALDAYALGYCIANFPIGVPWDVVIRFGDYHSFSCGLNTKIPREGVINRLKLDYYHIDFTDLRSTPLHTITALQLSSCSFTSTDMVHLSDLIPLMTCLEELDISFNENIVTDVQQDGLLKVLHRLYNSNVTSLDISSTGMSEYSRDHLTALKCLMDPSSGILKHLALGGVVTDDKCVDLLSAPSSLKSLDLWTDKLPLHALHLKNNTHLTKLKVESIPLKFEDVVALMDIVAHNRTLEELSVGYFKVIEDIGPVRCLVSAFHGNCHSKLQKIEVNINEQIDDIPHYMTTQHKELTLDSRIKYIRV